MHIVANPVLSYYLGILIYLKKVEATYNNAYFGHDGNQSKVQQVTIDGNFLHLTLNSYPTGLIHNNICKFYLIDCIKKFHNG